MVSAEYKADHNTVESTAVRPQDSVDRIDIKTETEPAALGAAPPTAPIKKLSTKKTEGLTSDKRYLCYVCNKLFTRRRSVKEHLHKIHPGHEWDHDKSLEIIVDPATGIPVDPSSVPAEIQPSPVPRASPAVASAFQAEVRQSPAPSNTVIELKGEAPPAEIPDSVVDSFVPPGHINGKKRPALNSGTTSIASTKKGTANKMKPRAIPANKKQKMTDSDAVSGPPGLRSPSGTPAPSRYSKAPAARAKKQSSASVASSPTPSVSRVSVDDADDGPETFTPNTQDDGEVFCVCRKGDNHSYMIACDGQCEDWYHGKCVGIRASDGDLIDKYICLNCTREGYQTTWKRMCRRQPCRKPALVGNNPPSKYCSADCGRMFFVDMLQRSDPDAVASPGGQHIVEASKEKQSRTKKRRSPRGGAIGSNGADANTCGASDSFGLFRTYDTSYSHPQRQPKPTHISVDGVTTDSEESASHCENETSSDEEPLPSRGGALLAREVKALVNKYDSIERWRAMGKKPTVAPVDADGNSKLQHDGYEERQLASIAAQMSEYRRQRVGLGAREKFLGLVKKRSTIITEEVRRGNPKAKDVCGFDARLSWSEEEFSRWRMSAEGQTALDQEALGPPSTRREKGSDDEDEDGDEDEDEDGEPERDDPTTTVHGVCVKNRCQRHGKWQKVQLAEIRFEEDRISRQIERLQRAEDGIRQRAVLRAWELNEDA